MAAVMIEWIAYAFIGAIAGLLAGLLGVSGGFITIPCLLLIFHFLDFPPIHLMQLAIGTSLAAMVFNTLTAAWSHQYHKVIRWDIVKSMTPGLILGCIVGAFIGHILPTKVLQMFFALFAIVLGIHFYRGTQWFKEARPLPSPGIWNGIGFGIGALSNVLGIGGGVLSVPVFTAYRLPMRNAIGSSAAAAFIITFIGAIGYLIFGLGETYYKYTVGYIYLPAFCVIAVTTFFAAPLGARLTHSIDVRSLKRLFAVVLFIIGISMFLKY